MFHLFYFTDQSQNVRLPNFFLKDFIPTVPQYYRYLGSLTTPPCSETVVWTVMKKALNVTEAQLNRFRQLHDEHSNSNISGTISDNFRDTQSLDGRTVRYCDGTGMTNFKPSIKNNAEITFLSNFTFTVVLLLLVSETVSVLYGI